MFVRNNVGGIEIYFCPIWHGMEQYVKVYTNVKNICMVFKIEQTEKNLNKYISPYSHFNYSMKIDRFNVDSNLCIFKRNQINKIPYELSSLPLESLYPERSDNALAAVDFVWLCAVIIAVGFGFVDVSVDGVAFFCTKFFSRALFLVNPPTLGIWAVADAPPVIVGFAFNLFEATA